MRGGVNVTDLFHIYGYEDRTLMGKIIKDNLEMTKNAQMPLL